MLPADKQGSLTMADSIPVLDLAQLRAGAPGALEKLGEELRHAFTEVGFYFVRNHGIPQALLDQTFAEAARFHAQPLDAKMALKINEHNIGYMPMRGATTRPMPMKPCFSSVIYLPIIPMF
jgi:isopenicillin N synthase-like dioxygenase